MTPDLFTAPSELPPTAVVHVWRRDSRGPRKAQRRAT